MLTNGLMTHSELKEAWPWTQFLVPSAIAKNDYFAWPVIGLAIPQNNLALSQAKEGGGRFLKIKPASVGSDTENTS